MITAKILKGYSRKYLIKLSVAKKKFKFLA